MTVGAAPVERVLLLGSKSIGVQILRAIVEVAPGRACGVITVDDRGDARCRMDALAATTAEVGIPLQVANDRAHADALIRAARPDICIVASWYWLLSREMLEAVPRGFVGVHNSLLPKYRGGAPLVWALINGEREVGSSIFSFREGIDEGPIFSQVRMAVEPHEYIGDVAARLERETVKLFKQQLPLILRGELIPSDQRHADASFCAQRTPDDGEIDWNWPARRVHDFIRAQAPPYPGAFTIFDGAKLIVTRAAEWQTPYDGTPGQVAYADRDTVVVICGSRTALRLIDVDAGRGIVPAPTVVRSIRTRFPRHPGLSAPSLTVR